MYMLDFEYIVQILSIKMNKIIFDYFFGYAKSFMYWYAKSKQIFHVKWFIRLISNQPKTKNGLVKPEKQKKLL